MAADPLPKNPPPAANALADQPPLKRVVLFKDKAWLIYEGIVDTDFKLLDGGFSLPVPDGSDPTKALAQIRECSLGLRAIAPPTGDSAAGQSLADMLKARRGAQVWLDAKNGKYKGRIVWVETRPGTTKTAAADVLTLLVGSDAIQTIPIAEIKTFQFVDRAGLERALSLLGSKSICFTGAQAGKSVKVVWEIGMPSSWSLQIRADVPDFGVAVTPSRFLTVTNKTVVDWSNIDLFVVNDDPPAATSSVPQNQVWHEATFSLASGASLTKEVSAAGIIVAATTYRFTDDGTAQKIELVFAIKHDTILSAPASVDIRWGPKHLALTTIPNFPTKDDLYPVPNPNPSVKISTAPIMATSIVSISQGRVAYNARAITYTVKDVPLGRLELWRKKDANWSPEASMRVSRSNENYWISTSFCVGLAFVAKPGKPLSSVDVALVTLPATFGLPLLPLPLKLFSPTDIVWAEKARSPFAEDITSMSAKQIEERFPLSQAQVDDWAWPELAIWLAREYREEVEQNVKTLDERSKLLQTEALRLATGIDFNRPAEYFRENASAHSADLNRLAAVKQELSDIAAERFGTLGAWAHWVRHIRIE